MNNEELLRVSDFFVILIRGKKIFISTWLLMLALGVAYLLVAGKSYRLSGTLYLGRLQEILLEEGEFVAQKLQDYSFVNRALERASVTVDIPVSELVRNIKADVVNEIKKIDDVGIVQLTVEYDDPAQTVAIFDAITSLLIEEHGRMLADGASVFKEMEDRFWADEERLRLSLEADEQVVATVNGKALESTIPSYLLLGHTIAEKRTSHQRLIKDIHYLKLEGESATKSFNTRLAARPSLPDKPFKPKRALVLIITMILATLCATAATLGYDFYREQIAPKV